ncbi:MAG: pitrilysin family protein, partial [Pseudomonadota bacterium]
RNRGMDGLRVAMKEPGSLARYVTRVAMYGDAPYGTQPNGTRESLAQITREDLLSHQQGFFHPEAMQIVVSGGIAPERAIAVAEGMFGDWEVATPAASFADEAAGEEQPVRTIVIDMPDAGQASVIAAVRAPSRQDPDYFPLELANSVLGGGASGRLFEEVRTKRSLSYGAYSGFADRADDSILTASAQTKNESAAEVAKLFLDEFERLGSEPLSEDLLQKRRLYLSGSRARALETSGGFNAIVATLLQQGLGPEEAAKFASRLAQVDAEAASKAARDYVDPDKATLVIVGDAKQFIEGVQALRDNVEIIQASALDLARTDLAVVESASDGE